MADQAQTVSPYPGRAVFLRSFARIGLMSFGGPAAQIAVMHRELTEQNRWLTEQQFLSALSFCMMLPGPEAMQLATYCGWRLRGTLGGVVAGLLFVLPGAVMMLALALLYALASELPAMQAVFSGVKATVIVIVVQALIRLSQKALGSPLHRALAVVAFVAIALMDLPFPLVIAVAALVGAWAARGTAPPPVDDLPSLDHSHLIRTISLWGALWIAPLAALWIAGADRFLSLGLFFSKLAVVTFGGAYAVLAYMSQQVVETHGWLTTGQMMDGLGLAETTLGPLILVTEFVGFLAAYGITATLLGGILGAVLTLWVTFVPCFLWIFASAPYVAWIETRPRLNAALKAITAAVVGVIASLSAWFTLHALFARQTDVVLGIFTFTLPDPTSHDALTSGLTLLAALLLLVVKRGMLATLAATATAGFLFGAVL